jgi:hypothetical protein
MAEYCEICGEELDYDEEEHGICKKCKKGQEDEDYEKDDDYIDPGVT